MITETREIYTCEFCRKIYKRKHFALKHENLCFKNPGNYRPCFKCANLTQKDDIIDTHYATFIVKNLFYCKHNEYFIYTPQNEIKRNIIDIGENYPMPKECEYYK